MSDSAAVGRPITLADREYPCPPSRAQAEATLHRVARELEALLPDLAIHDMSGPWTRLRGDRMPLVFARKDESGGGPLVELSAHFVNETPEPLVRQHLVNEYLSIRSRLYA